MKRAPRAPGRGLKLFWWLLFFLLLPQAGLLLPLVGAQSPASDVPPDELLPAEPQSDELLAEPQPLDPAVIRVNASLVSVPVAVTDAAGHAITQLRLEDFRLKEDGKLATISRLTDASQSSLNVALLFDLSGSVNPSFEFERRAALDFLKKTWKAGDTITIVPFDEKPDVRLHNSNNILEAFQVIEQLQSTRKPTAFFDTMILAVRLLELAAIDSSRQVLIAISDGADNFSFSDLNTMLTEVQRRDTVFYAINPSGASVRLNRINIRGQENLTTLAQATGGSVFVSDQARELGDIFSRIATELRAQYLLHYYSLNTQSDGRFHTIEVSLPAHPELKVRARSGYRSVAAR